MKQLRCAVIITRFIRQPWLFAWIVAVVFAGIAIQIALAVFSGLGVWNRALVYGALALLCIPSTFFIERLLDLADPLPEFRESNYVSLIFASAMLYTLLYGPAIFIKYYEYDDWVYLAFKFQDFSWDYLLSPINDHFVPLLRALLYVIGYISDPNYFGYAFSFYLAGLLVLCAFARVVRQHAGSGFGVLLLVLCFAVWPSFETARTWFGGGFWLALPVGGWLTCLLALNRIAAGRGTAEAWIVLGLGGFFTVLSSSQILLPAFFAAVYMGTLLVCAMPQQRVELLGRILRIVFLLSLPTMLGLYGRLGRLGNPLDFSGLWNGKYLQGLGSFFSVKVLLTDAWYLTWPVCVLLICVLIAMWYWAITVQRGRGYRASDNASAVSLALMGCGLSMYLFFFLQVGLGRSWEVYAAINAYYASFPLTAMALAFAGSGPAVVRSLELVRWGPVVQFRSWLTTRSVVWGAYACGLLLLTSATWISARKYFPTQDYIQKVLAQKAFANALGEGTCDFLQQSNPDRKVFLLQAQPYSACRDCEELMMGPKSFLEHISGLEDFTPTLAKSFARRVCPDLASRLALKRRESDWASSGIEQSAKMHVFYKRYYEPIAK